MVSSRGWKIASACSHCSSQQINDLICFNLCGLLLSLSSLFLLCCFLLLRVARSIQYSSKQSKHAKKLARYHELFWIFITTHSFAEGTQRHQKQSPPAKLWAKLCYNNMKFPSTFPLHTHFLHKQCTSKWHLLLLACVCVRSILRPPALASPAASLLSSLQAMCFTRLADKTKHHPSLIKAPEHHPRERAWQHSGCVWVIGLQPTRLQMDTCCAVKMGTW